MLLRHGVERRRIAGPQLDQAGTFSPCHKVRLVVAKHLFLRAVPSTWDETRVITAEIGEVMAVARRKGDE